MLRSIAAPVLTIWRSQRSCAAMRLEAGGRPHPSRRAHGHPVLPGVRNTRAPQDEGGAYFNASPHFCTIARASVRESADVGGNCSIHANGRHASMITFECEVTPRDLSAAEMRGSSAELQALRTMSICSDGSQRVAIAHMTSLRLDGSISSSTTTMSRAM